MPYTSSYSLSELGPRCYKITSVDRGQGQMLWDYLRVDGGQRICQMAPLWNLQQTVVVLPQKIIRVHCVKNLRHSTLLLPCQWWCQSSSQVGYVIQGDALFVSRYSTLIYMNQSIGLHKMSVAVFTWKECSNFTRNHRKGCVSVVISVWWKYTVK